MTEASDAKQGEQGRRSVSVGSRVRTRSACDSGRASKGQEVACQRRQAKEDGRTWYPHGQGLKLTSLRSISSMHSGHSGSSSCECGSRQRGGTGGGRMEKRDWRKEGGRRSNNKQRGKSQRWTTDRRRRSKKKPFGGSQGR